MTHEQFAEIVKNIKYKPDSKIIAYKSTAHGDMASILEISLKVPCRDTLLPIDVKTSCRIDVRFLNSSMDVTGWVRDMIGGLEMHERDEWIKFHGVRIYEPHEGENGNANAKHL